MNTHDTVISTIHEVAQLYDAPLVDDLNAETVLLESGLDSLGFAAVVARLEEKLGYDPFVMTDEPVYPRTLQDFIDFYEISKPKKE